MDIDLVSTGKLRVTLNRRDVEELDVDLKNPDCRREDNRRVFLDLLERGKLETGFIPGGTRVFIEVYPGGDGGCIIYFTAFDKAPESSAGKSAHLEPVVFTFDNTDSLCDGIARLHKRCAHRVRKSSLYYYGRRFRLIVYPLDYLDRLSVCFISEYADVSGSGETLAAFIGEHGKEIIQDTAIDTLARLEGGSNPWQ